MTAFSTLLSQLAATPDGSTLDITDNWKQGRTLFGGLSAALCAAAGERIAAEGLEGGAPPLRSAQFAFIGPASGPIHIAAQVLRRGKSTVFVQADLTGEAGLATRGLLTFGAARPSSMDDEDMAPPAHLAPDDCPPLHGRSGGPGFTSHFDIRPADGVPFFSRDPDTPRVPARPDLTLWARHRDEAADGVNAAAALIALADIPPPAAMRLMTKPMPISTMTWMIDILTPAPRPEESGWRLLRSTAQVTRDGYSSQSMTLWDDIGRPLIIGRQNVAVFG